MKALRPSGVYMCRCLWLQEVESISFSQGCCCLSLSSSGGDNWAGSSWGSPTAESEAARQRQKGEISKNDKIHSYKQTSAVSWPAASHSARAWCTLGRTRPYSPAQPRTCWPDSTHRWCTHWSGSRFCPDQLGEKHMFSLRKICWRKTVLMIYAFECWFALMSRWVFYSRVEFSDVHI